MKVCFILPAHWSGILGGAEIQVRYIMDALRKEGIYDIYYICRSTSLTDDDGIKIYQINQDQFLTKFMRCVDYAQVMKFLEVIQPDIIYTRVDVPYVGMAARYCQKHDCKLIWHIAHVQDVSQYRVKNKRSFLRYIDRKIFEYGVKRADVIIGQAAYQNQLLQKNYGVPCTAIIPNFHPEAKLIKKENKPIKIVWVASIKASKQPHIFLQLAKAFQEHANVEFTMIGAIQNSEWEGKLQQEVNQIKNLSYLGELPLEKVNEILAASHIFVNTSKAEGFPNTFIQAWLRKVAVVSLLIDPDFVLKNNNLGGASGNLEQLIQDVSFLINQPEERQQIAERSYQFAIKNYSLSNIKLLLPYFSPLPSYQYSEQ